MPVIGYCRNLHTNLCPCFLCSKKFSLDNGVEDLLTHICFTHRVVMDNIDRIADFKQYMEYYAERYRGAPLESFTQQLTIEVTEVNCEPREQKYYLLSDSLPEDENLRKNLHAQRLEAARTQQKIDFKPNYFLRHCFYCHATLEVTTAQFVNHLKHHGFQLGRPEKLVYVEKFIETIEDTFRNLHCLYCETEFESCRALINHMEKKGHLKIHPNNRFYDQFYMINYLEFGKTWLVRIPAGLAFVGYLKVPVIYFHRVLCKDFAKEKKSDSEQQVVETNDDIDWSSWGTEPENITCLFCEHVCRSWDGALLHMQVSHNFDFKNRISRFCFYEQVKLVNYIRRRMFEKRCINCDFQSENSIEVVNHMEKTNHLTIPETYLWDLEEYFFCVMENDMLLCHLEDSVDENDTGEVRQGLKVSNAPAEQVDVVCSENLENSHDLRQNSELKQARCVTQINQFEEISTNSQDENAIPHDTTSNGIEPSHKTIKSFSSAHMGAGDSAQKIEIAEKLDIEKVYEFGDA